MLKVWLTTTANAEFIFEEIERVRHIISEKGNSHFSLAESPAQAEIIWFIETPNHKFLDYVNILSVNELIRQYPNKCFAFDWEDSPAGFLAGAYPSILRQRLVPGRLQSSFYIGQYNEYGPEYAAKRSEKEPKLLASFCGYPSSRVRKRLLGMNFSSPEILIQSTTGWFDHSEQQKREYLQVMVDSRFVICPRGHGANTNRLTETLMMGRVPVIASDDWSPPIGPSWADFAIIVAENRLGELPHLLEKYAPYWQEMGENARYAWENWCMPDIAPIRVLQHIEQILNRREYGHDERQFHAQWKTWAFAWHNEWTIPQKIKNRLRAMRQK